jgi:hypothetical protein
MNPNITKLIVEDLNDLYAYITYGSFKIMINKETRYFNMSKVMKAGGKEMSNWLQLDGSQQKIDAVYLRLNVYPIQKTLIGPNKFRGIYVHPILLMDIISFMKPDSYIDMYQFFNSCISQYFAADIPISVIQNQSSIISLNNAKLSERDWNTLMIDWSNVKRLDINFQYQINKYRVDAYSSGIVFEFDEDDHTGYSIIDQIVRTQAILKECNSIIRLSDSVLYTIKDIDFVVKYVEGIITKNNVIYVNYNKRRIIRYNKICELINVYEIDI